MGITHITPFVYTIDDLPDDMLADIRRHLSVRDRIQWRQVCRRTYAQDTDLVLPVHWRLARPSPTQQFLFYRLMEEGFHCAYGHARFRVIDYMPYTLQFKWSESLKSYWQLTCTEKGHPIDDTCYVLGWSSHPEFHLFYSIAYEWCDYPDDYHTNPMYTERGSCITKIVKKHIAGE
jgi:hypothetical protein